MVAGTSRLRAAVWLVGVVGLLSLAACQTDQRDSGGRGMQLSEWKVVEVSEVDVNLPLLIKPTVTTAEYRSRDNMINHYRMRLDGSQGYVSTERIPDAFFSDRSQREFGDVEAFKDGVLKYFKGDFVGFDDIRPVRHRNPKSAGFAAIVDLKDRTRDKCFVAKVGYRLKPRTRFDNDTGNADSLVWFRYCDPDVKMEDFLPAMENVEWVSDHAAFAAALRARK